MIYNFQPKGNISEVSYNEVVASWLKGEWHYSCFDARRYDVEDRIIREPDLSNPKENALRLELLTSNRHSILDKLSEDIKWYSISYSHDDIDRTYLISPTKWCAQFSGGSFALKDAACDLEKKLPNMSPPDAEKIRQIYDSMNSEKIQSQKLIFVASSDTSPFTVIEGNHRLIAMLNKAQELAIDPIMYKAYLGISPGMKSSIVHIENYFPKNDYEIANR